MGIPDSTLSDHKLQHSLNVSEFQTAQLDLLAEGLPKVEKDGHAIDGKISKGFSFSCSHSL